MSLFAVRGESAMPLSDVTLSSVMSITSLYSLRCPLTQLLRASASCSNTICLSMSMSMSTT